MRGYSRKDSIPASLLFSSSETEKVLPISKAGLFTVISIPPKRKRVRLLRIRKQMTSLAVSASKSCPVGSVSSPITRSILTESPSPCMACDVVEVQLLSYDKTSVGHENKMTQSFVVFFSRFNKTF